MSATEPLCNLFGIDSKKLSKHEYLMIEAEIFTKLCIKLSAHFIEKYININLMNNSQEKENGMFLSNLAQILIKDILSTKEYNLHGIAYYTDIHEDVVQEVVDGRNINPSMNVFYKIINLHRTVREDLYNHISKKIADEYLAVSQIQQNTPQGNLRK